MLQPVIAGDMFARSLILLLGLGITSAIHADVPPALVTALEHLRTHKSYSWEMINGDPGPVAQRVETRRGRVTLVQQNISPHIVGSVDLDGNTLIRRDWSDGMALETIILASGETVHGTPEGWMTGQEVLSALAGVRLQNDTATPRFTWLRRADRPDLRRPDQELLPLLKSTQAFETNGDSYTASARLHPGGGSNPSEAPLPIDVTVTLNVLRGVVRDYEVRINATQSVARTQVQLPVSEQRLVILTYLPVARITIPDEAREKLRNLGAKI
jgi:hypothetical protein